MTQDADIDGLAAEYVLGSLSLAERKEVEVRRKTDVALSEAVAAWERRLAPLNDLVPDIQPPPNLFAGLLALISRVPGRPARSAEVITLHRSARRWRGVAVGTSLLAACLALVVGWFLYLQSAAPTTLVAELYRAAANTTADEITKPAFVVTVDLKGCNVSVRPVTARPRPGQMYQLWVVRQGATPSSLGLIARSEVTTLPCSQAYPPGALMNAMLAVSVEPEGGSTTGAPTSSFTFVGKLLAPQTTSAGETPR